MKLKKRMEVLMGAVLIILATLTAPHSARSVMSMRAGKAPVCIAIDPGHGGSDPGKIGTGGTKEKDINLKIAVKLKQLLQEKGMRAVLTREEDTDLSEDGDRYVKSADLKKRCRIIEEARPALAISIHQNSFTDSSAMGAQVFYFGQSAEGKLLAEALQKSLSENLDPSNTRAAKANESYYMLKRTSVPTVIVECGFLSNPEEETLLADENYQDRIVEAIYEGIAGYLNSSAIKSRS